MQMLFHKTYWYNRIYLKKKNLLYNCADHVNLICRPSNTSIRNTLYLSSVRKISNCIKKAIRFVFLFI